MGPSTNEYIKLANIYLDKKSETVGYENVAYDPYVDVYRYCDRAMELFGLFRICYGRSHVDTVIESLLAEMQATKISMHGKLYFVPKSHLHPADVLEDYIAEINTYNRNDSEITANSIFLVDDEKQRAKMKQEFYNGYKKDIEMYQERIQHFIDSGCTSNTVINRWILKIEGLQQKKATYEEVLKRELDHLDDEFAVLKLQSQELRYQGKNSNNLRLCA